MTPVAANVHASAILVGDAGILIRGAARSGKSALAWSTLRRAEMLGLRALLVADDQVLLGVEADRLVARAPPAIAGLIEISGVGILPAAWTGEAHLSLLVDIAEPKAFPRLPDEETQILLGIPLRRIFLPARQAAFGADLLQGLVMGKAGASLTKS